MPSHGFGAGLKSVQKPLFNTRKSKPQSGGSPAPELVGSFEGDATE